MGISNSTHPHRAPYQPPAKNNNTYDISYLDILWYDIGHFYQCPANKKWDIQFEKKCSAYYTPALIHQKWLMNRTNEGLLRKQSTWNQQNPSKSCSLFCIKTWLDHQHGSENWIIYHHCFFFAGLNHVIKDNFEINGPSWTNLPQKSNIIPSIETYWNILIP